MRLAMLVVALCFVCACAYRPADEPLPQKNAVVGDADCAPYSPNHSVALSRDFENRLLEYLSPNYVPEPHCWYTTSGGELLLLGGQPLPPDHEYPDAPCAKRVGVPQEHIESSDADATGGATLDLRRYRPDRTKGHVVVCFIDQGFGWRERSFGFFRVTDADDGGWLPNNPLEQTRER